MGVETQLLKPRNGGNQISIRLDFPTLQHIDMIEEESGWTRSDIIFALVQSGLFSFYNHLPEEKVQELTKKLKLPLNKDVKIGNA